MSPEQDGRDSARKITCDWGNLHMEHWEKIEAVQRMQDYIRDYAESEQFSFDELYRRAGYSRRHADRIFKELTGLTPQGYVRRVVITHSAQALLKPGSTVTGTAFDARFDSHEGFTRAFSSAFGISPSRYQKEHVPIPLFVQYPVRDYFTHLYHQKEGHVMETKTSLCTVTSVERPARKLLFLRSKAASDYWTYCEELGCDWEGLFNSIPEKFDTAAILELPDALTKPGYSQIAAGVEVPAGYSAPLPEGVESAELPPCTMLYFQGEPFAREEEFGDAIETVFRALDGYPFARYGYEKAPGLAPSFNFGASAELGAKLAVPVKTV